MNEEQARDLGRRAASCKGFRPMPGMKDFDGRTWTPDLLWRWTPKVDLPDLRDPATLGCMLALVRETWGDPSLSVLFDHDGCKWRVGRWEDDGLALRCRPADTEAEALVAALEASP
ncbi:MAG: hypothetical protein RLZZ299_767 [Pseudomonadota bacterium]|jgi:hypothetical protein